MANIKVKIVQEEDLTIFTVEGDLSSDEILKYSIKYYDTKPTKLVLWDVSRGSVSKISRADFQRIASIMKGHTAKRANGKTALIGKFDVDFGIARMYEAYADIEEIQIIYKVFRNVDDALKWLQS